MKLKLNPKPFRYSLGNQGEEIAEAYLRTQGFEIVTRNYRCPLGEIDLVAKKKGRYHFVEVKTRSDHDKGLPQEAVHPKKQKRLIQLVMWYLKERKLNDVPVALDVIAVTQPFQRAARIRYIPNAFMIQDVIHDR